MKIVSLLRRAARWVWTGHYAEDIVLMCSGYRNIEAQLRVMSDEEFARYLKAHSKSRRKV